MANSLGYDVVVNEDTYKTVEESYFGIVNELETVVSEYVKIINGLPIEGDTAESLKTFAQDVKEILSDSLSQLANQIGSATKQYRLEITEIDDGCGKE